MRVGGRHLEVGRGYRLRDNHAPDNLKPLLTLGARPPTFAAAWRSPEGTFPPPGGLMWLVDLFAEAVEQFLEAAL